MTRRGVLVGGGAAVAAALLGLRFHAACDRCGTLAPADELEPAALATGSKWRGWCLACWAAHAVANPCDVCGQGAHETHADLVREVGPGDEWEAFCPTGESRRGCDRHRPEGRTYTPETLPRTSRWWRVRDLDKLAHACGGEAPAWVLELRAA